MPFTIYSVLKTREIQNIEKCLDNNLNAQYNKIAHNKLYKEKKMGNDVFSTRLKDLRKKKGISMDQLAKDLNVTKSRVNMWENNGTVPRSDLLIKLSKYFEVSADYLIGNDDESAIDFSNQKLSSLQRNLSKLNEDELEKAQGMLKAVFYDVFNDDEEDEDDI